MKDSIDPTASATELAPHFDLYDPEHDRRLWDVMSYAHEHCPVLKTDADAGYYIVTTFDDLRQATGDPATFSAKEAGLRGVPLPMPPLTVDPPVQTEYRHQLNPYLSRAFLLRYEEDMREIARDHLAKAVPGGHMEFMGDYAIPVTSSNLARVILNDDNRERIDRAIGLATRIGSEGSPDAFFDLAALAEELLRDREALGSTRDDVLGAIVKATVEGRPLTMEEKIGCTMILFTGGLDTTKAAMGNIVWRVAGRPELEARLLNPEWIASDLDEFLRLDTPIQFMARTVMTETEVHGCPLKPGDRLAIHFAAANRDPSRFERPDELDFDRARNTHAAFGLGVHRCIGLHFAKLQMQIAFEELFKQVRNVRLVDGAHIPMSHGVVRAPEKLPIEFDVLADAG